MKILLFASAYNGMCQRVHRELEAEGHIISIELSANEQQMLNAVENFQPELILCPFLKHRVPEQIWRNQLCLIVHPGIEGDRGPSSLDWAIDNNFSQWGVTLLQADTEMDAGDIWETKNFSMRSVAKASIYRREVISTAIEIIKNTLHKISTSNFIPRPLDYSNPEVLGQCLPLMRQEARKINWQTDTTEVIMRKINAADSFPGVMDKIDGQDVYLFGARAETKMYPATPGEIVGHRDAAICRATIDGSVWIRQLKMANTMGKAHFKLPALQVLTQEFPNAQAYAHLNALESTIQNDIQVQIKNQVAYLSFDFYNGAMSTEQCHQLLAAIRELNTNEKVRVIALMGGEDFWSNGIHLNCIQATQDPARESWRNINAIDDVVQEIINTSHKITVAALRANAGAGGAIVPLACDKVFIRNGVVLNPHYLTMGLYGSEYWTYLLPKRVGESKAKELSEGCLPVIAKQAKELGMVDKVLAEDWSIYHQSLQRECETLAQDEHFFATLEHKKKVRAADEAKRPLESYRATELQRMKAIFDNPESEYHHLRYNFVYKISCAQTPARLIYRAEQETLEAIA